MTFETFKQYFIFLTVFTFSIHLEAKQAKKVLYNNVEEQVSLVVSGKIDTTTLSDIHADLLNKSIKADKTFALKTTFDINFDIISPFVSARISPRNKAVWGNDKQNSTVYVDIKDVNAVSLGHNHKIPARIIWVREGWIALDYAKLFAMDLESQIFTVGAFPFSVGRGISLGDAYSVNPASLGFFSDNIVDQYAFGAKFSGSFLKNFLTYDLYGAMLENKATSVSETTAQTQSQAYGKKSNPARGFGKINWLGVARYKITPLKTETSSLVFEPYVVYNSAPEQTIEFTADASSKLTTVGFACDVKITNFEFGWEAAFNRGSQKVQGWDRNKIEKINRGGYAVYVYNHVYDVDPNIVTVTDANKVLYDPSNAAQNNAINNVTRTGTSNGSAISGTALYNGLSRFRDPYENKYHGYMAVADIAYKITPSVKIAMTGGIASGDKNPNANLLDPYDANVDGTYDGFIPLQEVYSGKQVKSAFVMGAGKLKRPLSAPNTGDQFAQVVNGFSNLKFLGFGSEYKVKFSIRGFKLQPNLLAYWEENATNKFDIATGLSLNEPAHKFLGTEGNIFITVDLSDEITLKLSGAVFKPGQHYYDIKGKPMNAAQRKIINAYNSTSIADSIPVLSTDNAYSFTVGMTYSF